MIKTVCEEEMAHPTPQDFDFNECSSTFSVVSFTKLTAFLGK